MSESVHTNTSLYSKGTMAVICAQFLSAFGDNALLFATLALMKQLFYPQWSQPVLQMLFVGAYILFAPFVGQFADSFAKGRVMMVANGLKLIGAGCICFGVNPFMGYTLVGIGAAAYSPAKYGILGELTTGDKLVKANGLMESSTIAAILLGSMAGGILADWHVVAAQPMARWREDGQCTTAAKAAAPWESREAASAGHDTPECFYLFGRVLLRRHPNFEAGRRRWEVRSQGGLSR